ncbi:hypothetical protein N665_0174s0013 [Sinapis alba]|nr:hypothetical protein N665_0174s0013 [Sinapis alba]
MQEKGWNTWEREPKPNPEASPKPSSTVDLNKYREYHKTRGHDTKECKQLHEVLLASFSSGDAKVQPPKPKPQKNNQSWTKNKAKKGHKAQEGMSLSSLARPMNPISVINSMQRKPQIREFATPEYRPPGKTQREGRRPALHPQPSKGLKLEATSRKSKKSRNSKQSATQECAGTSNDLQTKIKPEKAQQPPQINVIMGGSPHCGDSVRVVKDYRRQEATYQKWPMKSENDPHIVFSAEDTIGVHSPHNDPLLVKLGVERCDVTKVLIDIGSSVDLIVRDTLDKMGIDLSDVKPSTQSLTVFNGSSETMLGTIRLLVYACGITRTVMFSVISTKAHYNAIMGTPWIHSMKAVVSTYHQCVKFPCSDGKIPPLHGDQQAARDLLIATVKLCISVLSVIQEV